MRDTTGVVWFSEIQLCNFGRNAGYGKLQFLAPGKTSPVCSLFGRVASPRLMVLLSMGEWDALQHVGENVSFQPH